MFWYNTSIDEQTAILAADKTSKTSLVLQQHETSHCNYSFLPFK